MKESEAFFEEALKILENHLHEQTLHLQTVDLIGNVHYYWHNWKQASV